MFDDGKYYMIEIRHWNIEYAQFVQMKLQLSAIYGICMLFFLLLTETRTNGDMSYLLWTNALSFVRNSGANVPGKYVGHVIRCLKAAKVSFQ